MTVHPAQLLGVITPVGRNEPDYLRELCDSLSATAHLLDTDIQWVLALDSSRPDPDLISDVVRAAPRHLNPLVLPAPSPSATGPGSTRNRALEHIAAQWLLAIDSDDTVAPDGIAKLLEAVTSAPDLAWAAGQAYDVDITGEFLNTGPADVYATGRVPRGQFYSWRSAMGSPPFSPSATIARTDTVKRVRGWPDHWARTEDSALWSVLDAWFPGYWVPVHVLNYRKHPQSISRDPNTRKGTVPELMPEIAAMIHAGTTNPQRPPVGLSESSRPGANV